MTLLKVNGIPFDAGQDKKGIFDSVWLINGHVDYDTTTVRTGTYSGVAQQITSFGYDKWRYQVGTKTTLFVSFGLYVDTSTPNGTFNKIDIMSILDENGDDQLNIGVNFCTRNIEIYSENFSGTALGKGSVPILSERWYFIELKFIMDASSGTVVIKVDGETDATLTSIATAPNGDYASIIQFGAYGTTQDCNINVYYDDIIINDDSGFYYADFPGQSWIESFRPDGDDTVNWTKNGAGSFNYDGLVDTASGVNDGDTTTISEDTSAQSDKYSMETVNTLGTISAIAVSAAAKASGGFPSFTVKLDDDAGNVDTIGSITPPIDYEYNTVFLENLTNQNVVNYMILEFD